MRIKTYYRTDPRAMRMIPTCTLIEKPVPLPPTPKALAIAGAFYFFNQRNKPLKQPLMPGTVIT